MNLEKSRKRISKKAKMGFQGFQGYPVISITYYGANKDFATDVSVEFVAEEGAESQTEKFSTTNEIRDDETIQSTIVKIIERSGAKTVKVEEGVNVCF